MTQKVIAICVQKKNQNLLNVCKDYDCILIGIKPTQRTTTVNIWWRPK